jgi:hypothetical protein
MKQMQSPVQQSTLLHIEWPPRTQHNVLLTHTTVSNPTDRKNARSKKGTMRIQESYTTQNYYPRGINTLPPAFQRHGHGTYDTLLHYL